MIPSTKIKVAYLASEAEPLVKVGGLGDVAGSLPLALNRLPEAFSGGRGLDTRLFLPFHGLLRSKISPPLVDEFYLSTSTSAEKVEVFQHSLAEMPVYLLAGNPFGLTDPVYTADNRIDGEKYIFFTVAVLEFLQRMGWRPDIVHANDWHTAISAYIISRQRGQPGASFTATRTVLSVHNLPYTGKGAEDAMAHYQVNPVPSPMQPSWVYREPLPVGLLFADKIVAVSPTYAREILTNEYGCSLQNLLASRSDSLTGVINGIDQENWNPSTDKAILQPFSVKTIDLRKVNKLAVLAQLGLPDKDDRPLLVYVSRMDYQKGVDLALEGLKQLPDLPWNAVFLGTGNPELMQACQDFESAFPQRVRTVLRYDATMARQLYAGGDILLMPSRYEPCGISQMIAMRYGCVPLARATGGLVDTIIDHTQSKTATGFLFQQSSSEALAAAMIKAFGVYQNKPQWKEFQRRGMQTDFSWRQSAIQYAQIYEKLMES